MPLFFALSILPLATQATTIKPPTTSVSALLPPDEVKARVDEISDLDSAYKTTLERLAELEKILPAGLRKTSTIRGDKITGYSKEKLALRQEYLKLREKRYFLEPIYGLKEAMNQTYLAIHPNLDASTLRALNDESTRLTLGLAIEIARLREEVYHSNAMPVLHNMMISVSLKPRGACKHWAEDLLQYLSRQPRRFFDVTWGQAHGGKYTEHNTAVMLPRGGKFENGLVVDPWRTSGKIYWTWTTKDAHFPWKWWEYYGVQ